MSIFAWRAWEWCPDIEDGVLLGIARHLWQVNKCLQAACLNAGSINVYANRQARLMNLPLSQYDPLHTDGIPAIRCSCGIYALKSPPALPMLSFPTRIYRFEVLGIVEIWGKIITAENGYRAQYGQLKALIDVPSIVSTTYKVPNLPSIKYAKKEFFS